MSQAKRGMKGLSIFLLITAWAFLTPSLTDAQPNVTLSSADFGDVVVGTPKTIILNIQNDGPGELLLVYKWEGETNACGFVADESMNFRVVGVGEENSVDVTITWTPSVLGQCGHNFLVNHFNVLVANVLVTGTGVPDEPETPDVGMLLEFFDKSVDEVKIVGSGPGKSAKHRMNAFRNMLMEADALAREGNTEEACGRLLAARKKLNVFVTGAAVPELKEQIDTIVESLRSE